MWCCQQAGKTRRYGCGALLLLLQGCATTPALEPDSKLWSDVTETTTAQQLTIASATDAVALDFVTLLQAVLPPHLETLQISDSALHADNGRVLRGESAPTSVVGRQNRVEPTTQAFEQRLVALLRQRGYALQSVTADQGPYHVSTSAFRQPPSTARQSTQFALAVGPLMLSRHYEKQGASLVPIDRFSVALSGAALNGADVGGSARNIADNLRLAMASDMPIDTRSVNLEAEQLDVFLQAVHSFHTPNASVKPTLVRLSDATDQAIDRAPTRRSVNAFNMQINNLYYTNETNFSALLNGYGKSGSRALHFPDFDTTLSADHRAELNALLRDFDPATDVIVLLGTSTESTALAGENEAMALARSGAVVAFLQSNGISRTRILEEACWANHSIEERYPRSAVMADIFRRAS